MTEDDLYQRLQYPLELHAQPHNDWKTPVLLVLLEMKPAAMDWMCASIWAVNNISDEARRTSATNLSAGTNSA